ncbi:MAG TPA: hypothetical protein VGQ20_02410, partial [Acidimicrobiales bacterium]|nr:hypothetical protein [Acidimicrobiales bacterium]
MSRRLRAVAALVVTALAAPISLVAVAVTTAGPAAAAPRTLVVSGDDGSRNGFGTGAWTFFGGNDYAELKSLITDPTKFGPSGTVNTTFQISPTPITTVSAATLAGIDVFVSSAVAPSYTAPEIAALKTFVQNGGVVIASSNGAGISSAAEAFDAPVFELPARWEAEGSGTHTCQAHPGPIPATPQCADDSPYSAPAAAQVVANHPITNGPFGAVTSFRNWHTVTHFTGEPAGSLRLATLSATCDPAVIACAGTVPQDYNNNMGVDQPVLDVIPFGTAQWGTGAVVLTSDVDTFANHSTYSPDPANPHMQTGNRVLALNTFAWIADHFNPPSVNPVDGFTSMAPARILDTRNNLGLPGKFGAETTRDLTIAGTYGVPADATAVALNVTVTNATENAYLTVFPKTGGLPPGTSSVNFVAGTNVANMVIVKLGTGGAVSIFNKAGTSDVIADIVGYFQANTGDKINSVVPERIVDTRNGKGGSLGPIPAGGSLTYDVRALAGTVPATATAVALNVTATEGTTGGYFTVYPSGGPKPYTSAVNFGANQNVANLVITKLSSDGKITIFSETGATNLIIDVFAYFDSSGGLLAPLTPARLLDTRGAGTVDGAFNAGPALGESGVVELTVLGRGGVPATGATTVVLNITATQPTVGGYLSTWPDAKPAELTSNLNFVAGQTVPNLVVARV